MTSSRAVYRSRQVIQALRPRLSKDDLMFAFGLMSPAEACLFEAMESRDQRHSLEVMRRLHAGLDDRDVLVAALLHDCGKAAVPVWLRVLKVLSPGLVRMLGRRDGAEWRRAAYRLDAHEEIGAELARQAGATGTTVRLIRGRPAPEEAWKAELLRAADDAS